MAYKDERELSYTSAEKKIGTQKLNIYGNKTQYIKPLKKPKKKPAQVVAEVGDNFGSLANKLGIDEQDMVRANPNDNTVKAGATYNAPAFSGFTENEQYFMDNLRTPANYIDFLTHQETLDVTGQNKFGGRTSAPYETEFGDIVSPEGFNFQEFRMFGENTKDTGFWEDYRNLDVSKQNLYGGNAPTYGGISQEIDPRYQSYTPNELEQMGIDPSMSKMIETGGIPTYHKWAKSESGQWTARPPEAVFDELYKVNGIDPNDKDMVEWFWSIASDDMLYAAEFFDIIEWPQGGYGNGYGGYGGYGGMPTPSRQYGRGQQQTNGNYASYLSLTSWSI